VFFVTFFGFWVVSGAMTVVGQIWLKEVDYRCSGSMAQPSNSVELDDFAADDLEEAATKSRHWKAQLS